jgi:hypothetical protein
MAASVSQTDQQTAAFYKLCRIECNSRAPAYLHCVILLGSSHLCNAMFDQHVDSNKPPRWMLFDYLTMQHHSCAALPPSCSSGM